MWIYFTKHILERLLQRWITKSAIKHILNNYNWIENNENFVIYDWIYDNKKIRVITKKNWKHIILITSYYIWQI